MIGGIKQNGLNSVDIKIKNKALRLPWIYRIINGSGWNDIIHEYLAPMGGLLLLLRCNYVTKFLNFIPKFYSNILEYVKKKMFRADDAHLVIWNNKNVLVDGKSIFWKTWFDKGIVLYMIYKSRRNLDVVSRF